MAEKLDRLDEMERLLRRVIELKPDHHHAYNALGYSLAERNLRLPEARELIQQGARAGARATRSSPTAWAGSSTAWATATRRCACCARPTASRPDTEIAAHLGEVLWVSGQRDEARRVWREGARARRRQRRAARNAGPAAGRPVTPRGAAARRWRRCALAAGRRARRSPRRPPGEPARTLSGRLAVRVDADARRRRAQRQRRASSCAATPQAGELRPVHAAGHAWSPGALGAGRRRCWRRRRANGASPTSTR